MGKELVFTQTQLKDMYQMVLDVCLKGMEESLCETKKEKNFPNCIEETKRSWWSIVMEVLVFLVLSGVFTKKEGEIERKRIGEIFGVALDDKYLFLQEEGEKRKSEAGEH